MNSSNLKSSSIVPKCLKPGDPEAEIFRINREFQDLIGSFVSEVEDPKKDFRTKKFWEIDDILQNMIELSQNLIVRLKESENWKEARFWHSQIVRLWDQSHKLYQLWDGGLYPGSEAGASKMVVGLDCEGFEKIKGDVNVDEYRDKTKAEEAQDILLPLDDRGYLDVKPNVDEALARKEDYEDVEKVKSEETEDIQFKYDDKLDDPLEDGNLVRKENYEDIEKVKDDLDNVKFSEIKENDENCVKLKEIEEVRLIKYEDKLNAISDNEFKDEETLVIPQEISPMDSASSGIFFPEGCGLATEGKSDPNKDPVEIDGNSNNEPECDMKDTITKAVGELENITLVQSEVVVEKQVCFDIQNELKKSINDDDAATRMDEITDASIYGEDDDSLQVFEEGNDEIPKVEESYDSGYDDGNVQEVLVNNESVSTTGESFPNDTPESRLANEIKVQHEFNEISEVLAHEPDNNEDEAKPNIDNIEIKEDLPPDSNTKEPIVEVTVTIHWREAEKGVVEKCEELQTKIDLYTPDDIDGHYNEEEFYKKLGAMQDSYSEAKKSIRDLLCDYDDVMPTQKKEHWNRQATEIYERLKSHERQLRAAVTRAKGNVSASASICSASAESNASDVAQAKRKHALSKMKTNEEAIKKDAGKLQDKIFQIIDWKLEDDVMIGRGLKMADKWEKDLEKIIEKMRELETLQREFDVEESEVECERLGKLVEDLEEDVEEVKKKIVTEDNERELYSLDTLKVSKVNLPIFWGKDSEDFSRFKENIEKGFKTNRITRDEQIIKLRECLKGYARKLVPDSSVTEIKEAWRILKQAFGNPIKIINHRMEALIKLGMKPKSTSNHNTEIAWYIDLTTFLREIIELGIKNPDYSELIFSNKFAMELRHHLFPSGRQRDKLRECGGRGQTHLENMLELLKDWLEEAQINQQEIDIVFKDTPVPSRYSSDSSSDQEDSNDEDEEDFVDDRNPHESFGNIPQQVGGANLIFAHVMPSFAFSEDYGNPSQTKSVTSLYKEKLVNAHNEWEMNESVEEVLDEEQEDMFEYQEVSFEESDDDQDFVDMNDDNLSAAFRKAVSNNSSVVKKELHDYDEISGMESDDEFNLAVKEDKILVSQETSDEVLVKDNEAVLEDFKETTSSENDDQGSLSENDDQGILNKENDDQRSLIEDDDQKGSIDEVDDQPFMENRQKVLDDRVENEESSHVGAAFPRIFSPYGCGPSASPGIFFPDGCGSNGEDKSDNKDEEHVGVHYNHTECDVVELNDETLEVMYEDVNEAHGVSIDDEDEYDDVPTGKLSTCAEDSFHNIVNQTGEEMPDNNHEESTSKETDDKFGAEVNKEMLKYDEISKMEVYDKLPSEVSETFMNEVLNDGLEVFEDDAVSKHLNPDKNADAALEDDENRYEKPDVIKMLFRGTFSENAMEILENLNKFKKISFGNRDENGLNAHFSSPENPSYTFAEEVDDKDSETESFHKSEAIKNESESRDNDSNVKAKEVESDEDVIENVVDNDQKTNADNNVLKTVIQMVFPMLADWFVTSLIAKVAGNILMCMCQLVASSHLLALFNMFMETNTKLMEKGAQMMKMNSCCCASLSLLTGGERKNGGPYHAEETVMKYMFPTILDSLNNLLAVNTDYTEMEEEPDYLASVDTPTQSNKTLYGKGHSF